MADRFYQVQWHFTAAGQPSVTSFCIFGDDTVLDFTPMSAQGLADKIGGDTTLVNAFKAMLVTTDSLDSVVVRDFADPSGAIGTEGAHTIAAAGTRTVSNSSLPPEACALLKLKTDAPIRSGHGHMFLPPCRTTVDLSSGAFAATGYLAACTTFATDLAAYKQGGTAWSGGSWGLGVYSRTRRARGDSSFAFHVVTLLVSPTVRWLRSRSTS